MSRIVSIPLPTELWDGFYKYGFSYTDVSAYLDILVSLWRTNDNTYDVTASFITDSTGMDELDSRFLILDTVHHWFTIGQQVRAEAVAGTLTRWTVTPHALLLELDDDKST